MSNIEYRITQAEDSVLKVVWNDGWQLCCISDGKMYFSREVKRKRGETAAEHTPEYLEFRQAFPSKTWVYADLFVKKYNKLVAEGLHAKIMESVAMYKKELEVTWQLKICNPETFINQKRWMQEFRVVRNEEEKWVNEMLKDLPPALIEKVLNTKSDWEKANPTKKLTAGTLENMILKFKI